MPVGGGGTRRGGGAAKSAGRGGGSYIRDGGGGGSNVFGGVDGGAMYALPHPAESSTAGVECAAEPAGVGLGAAVSVSGAHERAHSNGIAMRERSHAKRTGRYGERRRSDQSPKPNLHLNSAAGYGQIRRPKRPQTDRYTFFGACGAREDRTPDLLHAMQALSQLSYGPGPTWYPAAGRLLALSPHWRVFNCHPSPIAGTRPFDTQ
jgi:hypothetical protein